jgi:hypothetical protein
MYCTLQEAWNIPSFDTKKKKGCLNPLSTQMDNSQSPPIANISGNGFDPYDRYTSDSGKEHALAMNLAQNATAQQQLRPRPQPQPQQQIRQQQPHPQQYQKKTQSQNMNRPRNAPSGINQGNVVEGFDQYGPMPPQESTINDLSYSAQANDYQYYCKKFGICTDPKVEPFTNSPQNPQRATTTKFNTTSIDSSANQVNMPYYGPNPMGRCSTVHNTTYELPISDNNRAQFAHAMNTAIDQEQGATQAWPYHMRQVDMNRVSGYYDEDLESFLTTQTATQQPLPEPLKKSPMSFEKTPIEYAPQNMDTTTYSNVNMNDGQLYSTINPPAPLNKMSNNPISPNNIPEEENGEEPEEAPQTPKESARVFSKPVKRTQLQNGDYNQSQQYIIDILLFIATGIFIILLCDQIFKLGMSYGMRDTVQILMPYLKELKIDEV